MSVLKLIYGFTRLALLMAGLISLLLGLLVSFFLLTGNLPGFLSDLKYLDTHEWKYGIPASASVIGGELMQDHKMGNANPSSFTGPGANQPFSISGDSSLAAIPMIRLSEVRIYIEPKSSLLRTWLLLPLILNFFLFSWIAWQVALLLQRIIRGAAFRDRNHVLISNIGYALVLVQVFFILMNLWEPSIPSTVHINDQGSVSPLYSFQFVLEKPFSLNWLLTGLVLVIIARAWKDGARMQEEQDLTL